MPKIAQVFRAFAQDERAVRCLDDYLRFITQLLGFEASDHFEVFDGLAHVAGRSIQLSEQTDEEKRCEVVIRVR